LSSLLLPAKTPENCPDRPEPGIVRALGLYGHVPGLAYWRAIELEVWEELWTRIGPELRDGPFLDLCCGHGSFTSKLRLPRKATGVDLDPEAVAIASSSGQYTEVLAGNACALPLPDDLFAYVFSNSSLEHVRGVEAAFAEVRRVLKPGGLFAFIVPTTKFGDSLLRPRLLRNVGLASRAEAVREQVLRDTDTFNRLTREQWLQMVEAAGLQVVECLTFMPPFAVQLWEVLHYGYTKPLLGGLRVADVARKFLRGHQWVAARLLAGAVRRGKRSPGGVQIAVVARKPA
jgi:SAM-dependent methyltransferase